MQGLFTGTIAIHETALTLRSERAHILASNIANADTPGYKARDMDFKEVFSEALESSPSLGSTSLKYRTAMQPSLDGNTVDSQIEKAEYLKNANNYLASLQFLNRQFRELTIAIRGE